jgi:hypothetical protein
LDSDDELVMATIDYFVLDYVVGQPPEQLAALFNSYGVDGWHLNAVDLTRQNARRGVFVQGGTPAEYHVVDYDTGKTPETLEADLDALGVDGWELVAVDMHHQTSRRAIMIRTQDGGSGGAFPDAPSDGKAYGRMNAAWEWVLAHDNDLLDGGNF